MITKTVRWQLIALLLVTLVGVGYAGYRYAGLDRLFGATTYPVTVQLADSGGIFSGADVTYRGVSVGRVGPLTLTDSGVDVQLDIERSAPEIPSDARAVVANLSPIGEQYVDLQPVAADGEALAAGSVIPQDRTRTPVQVETLLTNLDQLVSTVPLDSLQTVVSELGQGFQGTAQPLQQLLDTTGEFTRTATEELPATTALIQDARPVLTTQNEIAPQFQDFSRGLREVTEQLRESDPDLRRIIDDGPRAGDELSALLHESGPGLGESIANLRTTSEVLEPRQDGLRQLLVTYPGLTALAPKVAPGDGTAHLGLVVNVADPPVCTRGYEGTVNRPGADVRETPVNAGARCAEPPGSPTTVRGMQNVPRAATPVPPADAGETPAPPPAAGSDATAQRVATPGLVSDAAQILMGA
ncbi:phospholipid/cholesterol/gamma-HCH transport system substrate-binding protein [Pseudonocardia ammonioxydans]|uniref:Phospholipid/cholesterol/gamma-HCH transport system substrate-binding protein n=1 Tax=Pseudonocardia ammonioxydans TaxID=260086 RepID=A0A1I4RT44_PSUAM|nr:MlaD family protein [Pseudonocardia ammonioxydans]SFM55371.1 phospholipid/cholesterol/gamma-HCH transport system substrate-binding protein [Pseudonocardia ammonioxydans]